MRSKLALLGLLGAVTLLGSSLAVSAEPAAAAPTPPMPGCGNTSCHGQGICTFSPGWQCYLEPAGCAGNERCQPT